MSKRLVGAVVAGVVGAGIVLTGSPAFAASSGCDLSTLKTSCTSGIIANNPAGHWVDYHLSFYSGNYSVSWKIYDVDTGQTVRSGKQTGGDANGTVTGLYGRYRLNMTKALLGAGADGTLENNV